MTGHDDKPEMISCKEAIRFLYEFLDGEMDDAPADELRAHFAVCQRCYPHLRLEASFRAAVQRACGGPCTPPEVKNRLMAALAEADAG
jgi:anti-sigma factor (TIGR02949 family)